MSYVVVMKIFIKTGKARVRELRRFTEKEIDFFRWSVNMTESGSCRRLVSFVMYSDVIPGRKSWSLPQAHVVNLFVWVAILSMFWPFKGNHILSLPNKLLNLISFPNRFTFTASSRGRLYVTLTEYGTAMSGNSDESNNNHVTPFFSITGHSRCLDV